MQPNLKAVTRSPVPKSLHKKSVQFPSKSDETDLKSLRLNFPRQSFAVNSTSSSSSSSSKRGSDRAQVKTHSPNALAIHQMQRISGKVVLKTS